MFDLTPDSDFNTAGQRRKNNAILTENSNAVRKNEPNNKSSKSNKNG